MGRRQAVGRARWRTLVAGLLALGGGVLGPVAATGASERGAGWPWPVDTDPYAITGTFMEPRRGGYHAGLDIRTEGRVGLPVACPVDGEVVRVRTSPRGYGKALYVRADDGRTLVFAHLSGFHGPVQEVLREAMTATRRYEQDLWIEAGRIPVRRGEIVALSGESGTGAPHLHLEVREPSGRPVNPALSLDVPDDVAPWVAALRLVPVELDASSVLPPASVEVFGEGTRVAARGLFEVHVDVRDATGHAPFEVAPYAVVLRVDGVERYRVENVAFDFDQSSQIHLEIERSSGRRWLRLHARRGMAVPGRVGEGGPVRVAASPVRLEVEVRDAAGHATTTSFVLDPGAPASSDASPPRLEVQEHLILARVDDLARPRLLLGTRELDGPRLADRIAVAVAGLGAGRLELRDGDAVVAARWIAPGGLAFDAIGPSGSETSRVAVTVADADGAAVRPGGVLAFELDEDGAADLPAGLRARSVPLAFDAAALAWRDGYALEARGYDAAAPLVWVQRSGRKWSAVDTERVDDGPAALRARVRESGVYVLAEDVDDPRVLVPPAAERRLESRSAIDAHGLPRARWPELRVRVEDGGSGLGDASPLTTLGGVPYPAVWDPERGEIVFDWFVDPGPGTHDVEVVVTDRAGRGARAAFGVELSEGPR